MHDTPPETDEMERERLMALSGEERFLIGVQMSVAAREKVIASMPTGLPEIEYKRLLYQRLYDEPAPF